MIKNFKIFEEFNSDTILIDGIERSKYNSNGKLIHPTDKGIENFWKWFGDSKIIDNKGRPLVVYHGTNKPFDKFSYDFIGTGADNGSNIGDYGDGFYFTKYTDIASNYATGQYGSSNILPVYLKIINPINEHELLQNDKIAGIIQDPYPGETISEIVIELGHDGVVIENGYEYVVFSPTQIKSATGNQGTFDSNSGIIYEALNSDTILVDGIERSKYNSNGKLIHPTDNGIINFWKWFGDSKIIDNKGRPLVVYHGTNNEFDVFNLGKVTNDEFDELHDAFFRSGADPISFMGSHFTKDIKVANLFANQLYSHKKDKGNILPVYLKLDNIISINEKDLQNDILKQNMFSDFTMDRMINNSYDLYDLEEDEFEEKYNNNVNFRIEVNSDIRSEQHSDAIHFAIELAKKYKNNLINKNINGIIYENDIEGGISYIAFYPNQIKSATGNQGTFDSNSGIIYEALNSDTILVDGIERSKYNSNNKLIHPTDKGIVNFWKWFGDSKVVDNKGRPLVVYHGSSKWFNKFNNTKSKLRSSNTPDNTSFFTDSRDVASSYTYDGEDVELNYNKLSTVEVKYKDGRVEQQVFEKGGVYACYLNINKPLIVDANENNWDSIIFHGKKVTTNDIAKLAIDNGYNGIVVKNVKDGAYKNLPLSTIYSTFFPTQIKSAAGNQGTFDSSNPNILEQKIDYFLNSINEDLTISEFKEKALNFLLKLKSKEDIKLFLLRTVKNLKLKKHLIFVLIKTVLVLQLLTFSELSSIFKDTQYSNIVYQYKKYTKPKDEFIAKMFQRESSSRPNIVKSDKHGINVYIGGFQLSKKALKDLGININHHEFKKNPNIFPYKEQEKAFMKYIKQNEHYLRNYMNYIGKTINGIEITKSGLLAAAHLVGQKKVKWFLTSNGVKDFADGNGVKCSDYMSEFSGYDLD